MYRLTVLVGIILAGITLAGITLAGIILAGVILAGITLAGIILAGITLAGIIPVAEVFILIHLWVLIMSLISRPCFVGWVQMLMMWLGMSV